MKRRILQIALTFLLLVVIAFGAWRGWLQWRLAALEAELRAAGNPVTVEELYALYPKPEPGASEAGLEEVLAQLTQLASRGGPEDGWETRALPFVGKSNGLDLDHGLPELIVADVQRFLAVYEPTLDQLMAVLEDPDLRLRQYAPAEIYYPFHSSLPMEWDVLHDGAQALELRTLYCAQYGDMDRAVANAVAARRLCTLFQDELGAVSYFNVVQMQRTALDAMNLLLCFGEPTAEHLAELDAVWQPEDTARQFRIAHQSFFCLDMRQDTGDLITIFRPSHTLETQMSGVPEPRTISERFWDFLLLPRTQTYWLQRPGDVIDSLGMYRDYMVLAASPMSEWKAGSEAIAKRATSAPPAHYFTAQVIPVLSMNTGEFLAMHDRNTVARAVIAVERYRLDRGELPGSIDDLIPAYLDSEPISQYTQEALTYVRPNRGGYVVSNVDRYDSARHVRVRSLTVTVEMPE